VRERSREQHGLGRDEEEQNLGTGGGLEEGGDVQYSRRRREATSSRAILRMVAASRAELVCVKGGEGKGTVLLVCVKWGRKGES
jgi:hypothetical protein